MRNEHLKTISGQEFGTTYPQKTWPCKGTVKVHEGLLTPLKGELNCATGQRDSLTIDSVRLGDEDVLLVAGELLVADHEGHPVAGIVEHLGEERLLPLQVEVLELHPDIDSDMGPSQGQGQVTCPGRWGSRCSQGPTRSGW